MSETNKGHLLRNIAIVLAIIAVVTICPGLNVFKPMANGNAGQILTIDPTATVVLTTKDGGHTIFNGIVSIEVRPSDSGVVSDTSQAETATPNNKKTAAPANALPANWSNSAPVQQYSIMTKIKEAQDNARYQQQNAAEKQSKQDILGALQEMGVSRENVSTNGYVYEFVRNGYYISFCDQDSRIVGEMYKVPHNSSEQNMLEQAHIIVEDAKMDQMDGKDAATSTSISLAQRLINEYGYREICIDGRPADDVYRLLA